MLTQGCSRAVLSRQLESMEACIIEEKTTGYSVLPQEGLKQARGQEKKGIVRTELSV